jgi:hypothetical protein
LNVGVLGFSGVEPDPEGPIQQNSYSGRAGFEGGSVAFTGTSGVSLIGWASTARSRTRLRSRQVCAGVLGAANTQPGVVGFSREGDGIEAASFSGTALRAVSVFGPCVQSISGALSGVFGVSGTQGPTPVAGLPTTAGVLGSSDAQAGVIGTSNTQIGVLGFSNNVGIVGQTTNDESFVGVFVGNVIINGALTADLTNSVVTFPDRAQRVLHCMESPELWFEDFGTAKLADIQASSWNHHRWRALVRQRSPRWRPNPREKNRIFHRKSQIFCRSRGPRKSLRTRIFQRKNPRLCDCRGPLHGGCEEQDQQGLLAGLGGPYEQRNSFTIVRTRPAEMGRTDIGVEAGR